MSEEETRPEEQEIRYKKISDLPETLRATLPKEGQKIYLDAYKKAWDTYEEEQGGEAGRQPVAHRNAMTAVQRDFVHDSESGRWRRKGTEPGEKEEGIIESIKEMF
jgi:cation transport regulator ChaB